MNIVRYGFPIGDIPKIAGKVIFLAGPTVRGNQPTLVSWRPEAVEKFKELGFDGTLILPDFADSKESDKGRRELPIWEHEGLKRADCILFWIPRTRELWGLNTNSEHHLWTWRAPNKVVYGRPDGAYRIDYNDIMWDHLLGEHGISRPIHKTLEDTIKAAIELVK